MKQPSPTPQLPRYRLAQGVALQPHEPARRGFGGVVGVLDLARRTAAEVCGVVHVFADRCLR
jgi:hypothetical protein